MLWAPASGKKVINGKISELIGSYGEIRDWKMKIQNRQKELWQTKTMLWVWDAWWDREGGVEVKVSVRQVYSSCRQTLGVVVEVEMGPQLHFSSTYAEEFSNPAQGKPTQPRPSSAYRRNNPHPRPVRTRTLGLLSGRPTLSWGGSVVYMQVLIIQWCFKNCFSRLCILYSTS